MHTMTLRLSCTLALATIVSSASLLAQDKDEWPQWRGPTRDGVWHEKGILDTFEKDQIDVLWRVPIGSGYASPTVAGGLVYVTDRQTKPDAVERVHCFDWKTGEAVWSHSYACSYAGISYPAGPRCAVLVEDGRAFSLGAAGHLNALDAKTGKLLWQHDLNEIYAIDMPIWGITASPVIESEILIVPTSGTDGTSLVGFDVESGDEVWAALPDRGNYSAPIVIDQAGKRVLVHWTGDRIVGLDPLSGELHWEVDFKAKRMPLGVASPVLYEDKLFFTGFYDGCILLRVKQDELAVEELWRRVGQNERSTNGLQSIISTPLIQENHIYGVDSYGEMRCLQLSDGERVWENLSAVPKARWATIHFIQNGDRTFMLNERGELMIGKLSPEGFEEVSRAKLIEPTLEQLGQRGGVVWSHPAFAHKHIFARNDEELLCADLSAPESEEKSGD